MTHLIATTEPYTGSQRFAPIPNLLPVLAITQSHLILGRVEELYPLADTMDNLVKENESDKAIQVGRYEQRADIMDEHYVYLKTPGELRAAGFQFMDVIDSQGLWAKLSVYKANQPQLVLLTSRTSSLANGFEIHPSPPEMVPTSSSDSSDLEPDPESELDPKSDPDPKSSDPGIESDPDSESDPSSGPPSTGLPDLAFESYEASEEEDDQGGNGYGDGDSVHGKARQCIATAVWGTVADSHA
jgi:hypothetical protein